MSIARHHIEWIQLTEVSGPFLSLPVLLRVFPQGLERHDSEHFRYLKAAFEEWQDNQRGLSPDPAIHEEWVRFVITETLEWGEMYLEEDLLITGRELPSDLYVRMHENQMLPPDFALMNPDGIGMPDTPRILISVLPPDHDLEKSGQEHLSPAERMMQLLRSCDVRTGLLTNGERWMLIYAPREGMVSYISWYASLWFEEHITLRAFRSLLSSSRFVGVSEEETPESLFLESAENQQDVTDQLGFQVRKAVEVLIQALDREDRNTGRELLTDRDEKAVYDAALTIMMRLVFLISAEERKLLLLGEEMYDRHYSVSTLREQLRKEADRHGEEVLEYRHDAWYRLLATFRAVYGGMNHDVLHLPAYGGRLFDPDRYPFLEGRDPGTSWRDTPAVPLPVNNRTVLHLLSALQILREKVPGGGPAEARRLSFRALGVEQIGYVYEGLLDHTAVRAAEPVLGLRGAKDKEEEVLLSELEQLRERDEKELIKFLKKRTGRSVAAIRRELAKPVKPVGELAKPEPVGELAEPRLLVACDNDQELKARVMRYAALLREDSSGYPVVIAENSIYVTRGTDRRTSGTHYTPPELTEPIVRHTLEPLVYEGVSEGRPEKEWKLRTAREILSLKVCDMAMGSGAFLVQAGRYLAGCLTRAWDEAERDADGRFVITPEGDLSKNNGEEEYPIPEDSDERYNFALRVISEQCLYGVDKNPMAAEMAKLSLWLETMAKNRPFTFLDHALKCGDSLLGVNRVQLKNWSGVNKDETGFRPMQKEINDAIAHRNALERMRSLDIRDVERKEALHRKAEAKIGRLKLAGDLIVAPYLMNGSEKAREEKRREFFSWFSALGRTDIEDTLREKADELLGEHSPFHWALEFPEIFMDDHRREGFDAIIGNPPFQGGQKITGALGTPYRNYLVGHIANGKKGSADLCAYFYLRAVELMREKGVFGLLATNTIAQGDTREVGLDQIADNGGSIIRALPSMKWPGTASLEVSVVWISKEQWGGTYFLNDESTEGITPFLVSPGTVIGNPYRLKANENKSFLGTIVLGLGFVLTQEEAKSLVQRDPKNANVLFPYLNGEDLNSRPDQSPSRWIINFRDWPLDRNASGEWSDASDKQRKKWLKIGIVPKDYPDPVAADFPTCLSIIKERVKPERMKISYSKRAREKWWLFERFRPELYNVAKIAGGMLCSCRVTKYISHCHFDSQTVFDVAVNAIVPSKGIFSILSSSVYKCWVRKYGSTLETRIRYTLTDCFETLPFPEPNDDLENIGQKYYDHRQSIMKTRQEGLTATYNRFHNEDETDSDIQKLRELHIQMDNAVAQAYGWTDLDLEHGFHETKQGIRFTISEPARREVLDRLLQLNHERYAEEVARGLHDKGKKKKTTRAKKSKKRKTASQKGLFSD